MAETMNTPLWIVLAVIVFALGFIFRKHLKKFFLGLLVIIGGWFGIDEATDPIPPDPIEIPVDTTDIEQPVPIDTILKPKDTIGKVFEIELSEVGDQTASLQDQIDAVPDGKPGKWNVIQLPEGRFWTEGVNITREKSFITGIVNRHYLVIRGPSTFYTKAPNSPYGGNIDKNEYSLRRHFWIRNSSNIIVEDVRIEGSNTIPGSLIGTTPELTPDFWKGGKDSGSKGDYPAYKGYWEFEHGFTIYDSQNISLLGCEVFGVWGDGVYLGNSPGLGGARDIIIKDCVFELIGRQGIAASVADGVLIDNVKIIKGRRASIDLEPYARTCYVRNVEIRDSFLNGMQTAIAAGGHGDVSYINIHDNEIVTTGGTISCYDTHKVTRRTNWIFRNNTRGGFGSPAPSIQFVMTDNILIEGNDELITPDQSLRTVRVLDCENVVVKNNNFGYGKYIISIDSEVAAKNNTPEQIIQ